MAVQVGLLRWEPGLTRKDILKRLVNRIFGMAEEAGTDCIVTSCRCAGQSRHSGSEVSKDYSRIIIPDILYSELIALAMGSKGINGWVKKHLVDPSKLLRERV